MSQTTENEKEIQTKVSMSQTTENEKEIQTKIHEICARINYFRLLHNLEISSLISPDHYLVGLENMGFNEDELNEVKTLHDTERFGKMMSILLRKNINVYNTIETVKNYCNTLPLTYKNSLLDNIKKYESEKGYYEMLTN